jgi:hypothetical protein
VNFQTQDPDGLRAGKEATQTLCIGGWVGSRTGVDVAEKREILSMQVIEPRLSS